MQNTILIDGKRYICLIYDNEGTTLDRYTIVYRAYRYNGRLVYPYTGASEFPFQSIGYHGESNSSVRGRHLGKRIEFDSLPINVKRLIIQDLKGNKL